MPLSAGTRLGPYEIILALGVGGMGEVYRGRDTRLNRYVAIKVSKEQFSERFAREAQAIAALNHPNICQIYDVGPNYLVMELIEGSTLKGPVPLDQALKYGAQICDALDAAHKKGITHRDLKPANILVAKTGIKLLDFGLAKFGSAERGRTTQPPEDATLTMALTGKNEIVGTLYYMSPEQLQAQANGHEIDARSDIFSFGLVLYEMLTGKRAFGGSSPASVIAAIMERPAPSVAEVAPAALDRVLKKCLAKDPDERWQTARDLKDELHWIASESGAAATAAPTEEKRQRFFSLNALGVAIAVAAVFGFGYYHLTRTAELKPLTRFSVDLGPEAIAGPRITVAISPDGRRLVFVARAESGKEWLATRLLDQPIPTLLAGTENASDPFFSPDNQWIGFFANGKMKKISVQGGAAVVLCDAGNARGASWAEDGNIVVTLDSINGIGLSRVLDTGGTPQTLTKPTEKGESSHRWPQVLPGGQAVLFTAGTFSGDYDNSSIQALSLKTGQIKVVARGGYFGRYLATANRTGELVYIRQGTLFGVAFDPDRLEVQGMPTPLLEEVAADISTAGGQFDFSRDGTFVYLSGKSAAGRPLVWLDSTGQTAALLPTPGAYYSPRLSPDGKRVAFSVSTKDLQVYDWQRDSTIKLTSSEGSRNFPVWTPDGKHIVFREQSPTRSSLRWIRADGAGEPQSLLEDKAEADLRPYSFSPDGKRLAFARTGSQTGFDLWTLPLDASDLEHTKPGRAELFVGTMFDQFEPAFSPDGNWIAYRDLSTAASEVYVQPFPGPGGRWAIGTGRHPVWSRNGRELFYMARDSHIMVANYTAKGNEFAVDKTRVWTATQILEPNDVFGNLDLAPDGMRFVVSPSRDVAGGQKGSVHVTILLNFFDELRRKASLRSK